MLLADLPLPMLAIDLSTLLTWIGLGIVVVLLLAAMVLMATSRHIRTGRTRNWFSRLLYVVYVALIAVLAISSFGSLVQEGHLSGYALQLHVAAAGAFVFLMIAISFLYLPYGFSTANDYELRDYRWWVARAAAWALILSSIAVAATMLLSMLPWLDTPGLGTMATLHRYAGLVVTIAAIFHVFSLFVVRLGWR